jgi:hypothetical protein
MKHRIALISLLLALTVSPAFAQLGSGIVFDPTNYKNAVLRYLQLQQQLRQLQQTYNLSIQQYQFIQGQARQLQGMVGRCRAQFSQWQNLTAGDTLGNTLSWVNRPLGSPAGVNTYDSLKQAYGLEELSDGSTIHGMATIGQLRRNAQQLELHIKQLEDDSLSSAPDLNTQIAVLNKINAANVLLVRTMQDTNKLLAALLEQQLVTTERNRTSSVGSINAELYRQQHFGDVMSFTGSLPTRLQTPTGK